MSEKTNKLKPKPALKEIELELENDELEQEFDIVEPIEIKEPKAKTNRAKPKAEKKPKDIEEEKEEAEEKEPGKKPKKSKKKGSALKRFLEDERVPKVIGLFFILSSIFLFVSFVSYLFTGAADRATVYPFSWHNFFNSEIKAENLMGKIGAYASHFFIWNGYGLASFLFVSFLFSMGLNLTLRRKVLPLGKIFRHSLALLVIVSTTLAFITVHSGFPFGGAFGSYVNNWLLGFFGQIGTGAILGFTMLGYAVVTFNLNFNVFGKPLTEEEKAAAVLAAEEEKKKVVPIVVENASAANPAYVLQQTVAEAEFTNTMVEEPVTVAEDELQSVSDTDQEAEEDEIEEEEGVEAAEGETPDEFEMVQPLAKPVIVTGDDLNLDIVETAEEKIADEIVQPSLVNYDPTLDLSNYKYPELDLLENYGSEKIKIDQEELERNKNQIIGTLQNYGIEIQKIKATVGPTVTLYEIIPAPGVRISKIKNLEDDIALSLSALGIRIIAPIPGKGTIGIEVPNINKEIVSMRTLLASEKFQNSTMELPVALGKTISNEIFIADLAKMPHLLMAGATGQGKSVGVNALLVSLLYKKHPSQIKFVLIDPKKVELSLYQTIEKHFLAKLPGEEEPIIVDITKVIHTLKALCIEMDLRYDLLKEAQCRNLREYNDKFTARRLNPQKGHRFLPYIVLVIDEFADLIMTAGKEIEMPIARLAQLARAIGIHLIIATQRPSVNIITGTIKANFPARIAFKVSSKIDSRTILDTGGAEQLIGRGDMLISIGGEVIRLQCAFVDTPEVERVTEFISQQQGYPEAHLLPEVKDEDGEGNDDFNAEEKDDMFEEAARMIVIHQQGSTSLIQRKLKLGYNRAGRLMDQLEAAGIVGPSQGSKARDVLIKDEYQLEQFLNSLGQKV